MQTNFSLAQLADSGIAEAERILRACVHCGFCIATCPTYTLLADERDSPRGRIYLIKDMLENSDLPPDATHIRHVDRCLTCLSCMTTCPSGVHYMHLVDHARHHIERKAKRPFFERALRWALGKILPNPPLFRLLLHLALPGRWLRARTPDILWRGPLLGRLGAMLSLAQPPSSLPRRADRYEAQGSRRYRVALLTGCLQPTLAPEINQATVRLLTRLGVEVVTPPAAGCCGALNHHMGQQDAALRYMKANIAAWQVEMDGAGLDAIVVNASGCGTNIKDYGFLLRNDPQWAEAAARVSGLCRDISEWLLDFDLSAAGTAPTGLTVAYHSACSMQHGQKLRDPPKILLSRVGFSVRDIPEGHLCCGSAGVYNLLQPAIATRLRDRKLANIAKTAPDLVATGNIGCIAQLRTAAKLPVLHTVELLDWATGGVRPARLDPPLHIGDK